MLSEKVIVIEDAQDQIREKEETFDEIKSARSTLNPKMEKLCEKKERIPKSRANNQTNTSIKQTQQSNLPANKTNILQVTIAIEDKECNQKQDQ